MSGIGCVAHRGVVWAQLAPRSALMRCYSTKALDDKWRAKWAESPPRPHLPKDAPKYYVLSMFPYPSGMLHIGHLRVYTISDVLSRYRRMSGHDVIHPMGWDAFGLPAENAAIERGIDPKAWTYDNISKMKQQMDLMAADFDWDREVITCSPEYYKWTQKLFLMLYEAGFAYRKEALVNWDPVEKTVLANEQVDSDGKSWRSGAVVEKRNLEQWFLAITKLAPELLNDLKLLKNWPKKVKTMQRNWIGQSKGANVRFPIDGSASQLPVNELEVFTTRPDTLYGVQYVAVSLHHPLSTHFAKVNSGLHDFIHRSFADDSKDGFVLPGVFAASPLDPKNFNIPVFVAPYVIGDYGHGSVMGVPAHDSRDVEFWSQNMPGVPVTPVVSPPEGASLDSPHGIYTGKTGTLTTACGKFAGLQAAEGGADIVKHISDSTGLAEETTQLRLRDWLVSRQRFWGAPIPMVHCSSCGIVPVPDKDLPVLLPEGDRSEIGKPLSSLAGFEDTTCPSCGDPAKRDTDTMDTFMDSSWYFFRYTDPHNLQQIFDPVKASTAMPVDTYIGGVEHAILHLLYSRFISKFLAKVGAWDGGDLNGEPIKTLVTQGMVHGRTLIDPDTGRFLKPFEVDLPDSDQPLVKETQKPVTVAYEKMSKSKYNGADPVECIQKYGADATRAHILFQAPVSDVLNWDEQKIVGITRWIGRVHQAVDLVVSGTRETDVEKSKSFNADELALSKQVNKKISEITDAFRDNFTLNTVISDYMKLTRAILTAGQANVNPQLLTEAVATLLKLAAPVIPVNVEECWERILGSQGKAWSTIFAEKWPTPIHIPETALPINVIIDGRRRFAISADSSTSVDDIVKLITESQDGAKWLSGKTIVRVIRPEGKPTISLITAPRN